MGKAARVSSIDALKNFKLALAQFTAVANTALGEAEASVRRMTSWVEHEQPAARNRHDAHAVDSLMQGLRPLRQRLINEQ